LNFPSSGILLKVVVVFNGSEYNLYVFLPDMEIRTVNVTRYIMPFREGGSLPALAEADDDFKYVVKFRGTGHGVKTLIAELIGAQTAKVLGLLVPEVVLLNLDVRRSFWADRAGSGDTGLAECKPRFEPGTAFPFRCIDLRPRFGYDRSGYFI